MVESVYDDVLGRDEYDVRELTPDPFPYRYYEAYLNTPKVQSAIGAFTNFSSNGAVGLAFDSTGDDGQELGTVAALRRLVHDGVTVALYAGDADYNCNWLGNEVVAHAVTSRHQKKHHPALGAAGYRDVKTSDGLVHAQTKQAGKFSFTRFFEAGHEVPFYQPLAALEFFSRAIRGRDIETGTTVVNEKYVTQGPLKSLYREGNGTVRFEVTPANLTYDVDTNGPGAPWPADQKVLAARSFAGGRAVGGKVRTRPARARRGFR